MSATVVCPSCGAQVEFTVGDALVLVCRYCRGLVARGDRRVEDLGKLAEIVDTGTVLSLGLRGKVEGKAYQIVGRTQLRHHKGGRWDEWYLRFVDGRWGWLADAEGRYTLTFEVETGSLPSFEQLAPDEEWDGFSVVERGQAEVFSGEGELPYLPHPGTPVRFADLSGPDSAFATIDFSDERPVMYRGRELPLEALGLPASVQARKGEREAKEGLALTCPQCGGPIKLQVPDATRRVACAHCGALLDAREGALAYLTSLEKPKQAPLLSPGRRGKLRGVEYVVLGAMQRHVDAGGEQYPWREYLLHAPRVGFRWLTEADGHWSLVQPIPRKVQRSGQAATFAGKTFRAHTQGDAQVDWVVGEFTWEVTQGEQAACIDFVAPPLMLSLEKTEDEVQWSLGEYLPSEEVARAFGVQVPSRRGVGPHQPNPHAGRAAPFLAVFGWGLVAVAILVGTTRRGATVLSLSPDELCGRAPLASAAVTEVPREAGADPEPPARVFYSEPFELKGGQDVEVKAEAPVDNGWLYLAGDLVDEATGLVQPFELPVEFYHGVADGESWSEGDKAPTADVTALPGGRYTLRLECQIDPNGPARLPLRVKVRNGAFSWLQFLAALALIVGWAVVLGVRSSAFETKRWQDADFGPSG